MWVANSSGRGLLISLKATAGTPGPTLIIPVGSPPRALLRPVATRENLLDADDIRRITGWRNRYRDSFLTRFRATESQTAEWLVESAGPNDRKILFMVDMVDDPPGNTIGHMGLDFIDWTAGSGEIDAVVRGEEAAPGMMKHALLTLVAWARGQLGLSDIGVRVLSDNKALVFYTDAGFTEVKRVPLRRVEQGDRILWVEDAGLDSSSLSLVHMCFGIEDCPRDDR